MMFRSEEFYGADIVRNQVKSPVQWLVGSVRMLECDLPPTLVSWGMLRQLGQDLFAPPNVKGWDGGITWITTNTLLDALQRRADAGARHDPAAHRRRFCRKAGRRRAARKLEQALQRIRMGGVDVEKILTPEERADKDTLVAALENRLFQTTLNSEQEQTLQRVSRFQNQNVRRGHPHRHPADDVHAGIPSHLNRYEK